MATTDIETLAYELASHHANQVPIVDFEAFLKEREVDPDKLKCADDFRAELLNQSVNDPVLDPTLPWQKHWENFRFRSGEVSMWLGFSGSLKSMLTGYVSLDLIRQQQRVLIASFEMKPKRTLERMVRQAVGSETPTPLYVNKFFDWIKEPLWFYDHQGTVTPERVVAVVYYCAETLGIQHFVIDSLMKCVSKEDDYNVQKQFVDRLCGAAKELNVHIHIVHHSRKKENERARPTKQDAKGSGSIVDQVDNCFVVYKIPEEDKEKKPDLPDVMLYCEKQRNGEWSGQVALWFNKQTLQFTERPNVPPFNFVP